jgi:hypothetical protein
MILEKTKIMPNYHSQPTPEEEKVGRELDDLYPRAKSKTVVEYKGGQYQIKYFPLEKSEDGEKVKEWGHRWALVKRKN